MKQQRLGWLHQSLELLLVADLTYPKRRVAACGESTPTSLLYKSSNALCMGVMANLTVQRTRKGWYCHLETFDEAIEAAIAVGG